MQVINTISLFNFGTIVKVNEHGSRSFNNTFSVSGQCKNNIIVTFKEDINRRVNADFGKNANQAFETLKTAIEKTDYLKTDRIIRCIIFLSKGSINDLNKYIETATVDTRDVMLWAEYENSNGDLNHGMRRNFNNSFDESTNDVRE